MFEHGLEKHSERMNEIRLFLAAIDDAKRQNQQQASVKIDSFMAYKTKVCSSSHSHAHILPVGFVILLTICYRPTAPRTIIVTVSGSDEWVARRTETLLEIAR